jgi:Tfp pilus assembly protein PilZ
LALSVLLYGSENWTVISKDKSRLTAAEMKFMRKTAKYTWRDHRTNEEILNELKITSILDKITIFKIVFIQNVKRMSRSKLPNLLKKYAPRGKEIRADH